MKRFLILLTLVAAFIFAAQTVDAQTRFTKYSVSQDTIFGEADTMSLTSPPLEEYYDLVSCQLTGALYGAGDSVKCQVVFYQSNDANHAFWVPLPVANNDSIRTVAYGALFNDTDFEGAWLKAHITGVSTDTVIVRSSWIRKKDKEVIF